MASQTQTTTDHETIRRWVEEHGGQPASVRGTDPGEAAGVLRIDFPGGSGEESLEHISWDEWFDKFEANNLAFLYQQEKASGEDSTFFKPSSAGTRDLRPPGRVPFVRRASA